MSQYSPPALSADLPKMAPADSPEEDQVPSDKTSDKGSAVMVGMR
jgi:hypothetical protein